MQAVIGADSNTMIHVEDSGTSVELTAINKPVAVTKRITIAEAESLVNGLQGAIREAKAKMYGNLKRKNKE